VTVIPGPSAVTVALALSGFGGDRFAFDGFLPRKGKERARRLESLGREERAVVIFASPKRLPGDLADLLIACGPERQIAVTRELTKLHEESWVGTLQEAVDHWSELVKGEVTIVLGPHQPAPPSVEAAVALARELVESGTSVRAAARSVAEQTGVSRREVYESLISTQESS
jgi:16S rRNA (cytidine1402-2'-O)-methyltransferase